MRYHLMNPKLDFQIDLEKTPKNQISNMLAFLMEKWLP